MESFTQSFWGMMMMVSSLSPEKRDMLKRILNMEDEYTQSNIYRPYERVESGQDDLSNTDTNPTYSIPIPNTWTSSTTHLDEDVYVEEERCKRYGLDPTSLQVCWCKQCAGP